MEVPVYMEKIVEKILMLPQIVEVEKRVYMVEEINNLIAKEVSLDTHYEEYRSVVSEVQKEVSRLITFINSSGKQPNTVELKQKLHSLSELLRTESRIPKIVETVKEVETVKDKDRPVLVPVYDSEREKVLHLIISDLIEGIKGFNKSEIETKFSERVRTLFSSEFELTSTESVTATKSYEEIERTEVQTKWKSWL
jgi:hypothetical protein